MNAHRFGQVDVRHAVLTGRPLPFADLAARRQAYLDEQQRLFSEEFYPTSQALLALVAELNGPNPFAKLETFRPAVVRAIALPPRLRAYGLASQARWIENTLAWLKNTLWFFNWSTT